jgi:hypothetical protein
MELVIESQSQTHEQTLEEKQILLEKLFSKNQLIPRIKAEFQSCKDFNFWEYFAEKEIPVDFGWGVLVEMSLHKRATLPTLVGLLYHHFDNAQMTANMLLKAAEVDLVDWNPELKLFITRFEVSDDVQRELDLFQFPLPMIVEPLPIENNRQSGYYLNNSSVILQHNHHDDDVCLDHLNLCNSMRLSINVECVTMLQNKWRNLDKPKECETAVKFKQRQKAFEKYDRTARDVMQLLIAEKNEFYLTHKYDKRGRTYCSGYHINYQGNAWNKAVIEFSNKELIE